jgi:hypothetical protein
VNRFTYGSKKIARSLFHFRAVPFIWLFHTNSSSGKQELSCDHSLPGEENPAGQTGSSASSYAAGAE